MIDSVDKRRAALSFGFMPSAGTLRPGTNTAFRRGSRLSLYPIIDVGDVLILGGWKLGQSNRVWMVGSNRVWMVGSNRVWKVWRRS